MVSNTTNQADLIVETCCMCSRGPMVNHLSHTLRCLEKVETSNYDGYIILNLIDERYQPYTSFGHNPSSVVSQQMKYNTNMNFIAK